MKLTEEQKRLVEENHDLIYFTLRKFNWNIEDYYGVAAYALCRAAITYNPAKNISFSTYAVKAMFNQVWNFRLYEMRKSPKEHMLSLEQDITIGQDDYSGRLSEMVSDHGSQIEEGYKRLYLSDLLTSLSERDKQILQLRMLGYNPKQISKILNISYTTMYNVLRKIKGRIKDND